MNHRPSRMRPSGGRDRPRDPGGQPGGHRPRGRRPQRGPVDPSRINPGSQFPTSGQQDNNGEQDPTNQGAGSPNSPGEQVANGVSPSNSINTMPQAASLWPWDDPSFNANSNGLNVAGTNPGNTQQSGGENVNIPINTRSQTDNVNAQNNPPPIGPNPSNTNPLNPSWNQDYNYEWDPEAYDYYWDGYSYRYSDNTHPQLNPNSPNPAHTTNTNNPAPSNSFTSNSGSNNHQSRKKRYAPNSAQDLPSDTDGAAAGHSQEGKSTSVEAGGNPSVPSADLLWPLQASEEEGQQPGPGQFGMDNSNSAQAGSNEREIHQNMDHGVGGIFENQTSRPTDSQQDTDALPPGEQEDPYLYGLDPGQAGHSNQNTGPSLKEGGPDGSPPPTNRHFPWPPPMPPHPVPGHAIPSWPIPSRVQGWSPGSASWARGRGGGGGGSWGGGRGGSSWGRRPAWDPVPEPEPWEHNGNGNSRPAPSSQTGTY